VTIKIPQQIVLPRWLTAPVVLFGAALLYVAVTADICSTGSNSAEQNQVSGQQGTYQTNQSVPTYQYSAERAALIQILDQRVKGTLNTWTVWYSNNSIALGMCASKGYPIPYSTELTNPWQVSNGGNSNGTGSGNVAVGQMDPQGTYPSQGTLATWVLCTDADGSVHAQYIEALTNAYTYPVEIRNGQVVPTGASSSDSTIKIGNPKG